MKDDLSFGELAVANLERSKQSFDTDLSDWSEPDWMTAVAGEVGEAANLVKKRRRGEAIPTQAVGDELADAVIYIDLLAQRMGLNLAACVRRKFNLVSDRRGSSVRLTEPSAQPQPGRGTLAFTVRELALRADRLRGERDRGCPCTYGSPCDPRCTCINGASSVGCANCCRYGNLEQRTAKARRLTRLRSIEEKAATFVAARRAYQGGGSTASDTAAMWFAFDQLKDALTPSPADLEAFAKRQELIDRGRCPNDDGDLTDDPEAPRFADGSSSVRECKVCGFVLTHQPIYVGRDDG